MKRRDVLKTISAAGALTVTPASVAKMRQQPAESVTQSTYQQVGRNTRYSVVTDHPADFDYSVGYFDLVSYHNDRTKAFLDIQEAVGAENFFLRSARLICEHPDYFSDFSQSLVFLSDEFLDQHFHLLPEQYRIAFRDHSHIVKLSHGEKRVFPSELLEPWFVPYD